MQHFAPIYGPPSRSVAQIVEFGQQVLAVRLTSWAAELRWIGWEQIQERTTGLQFMRTNVFSSASWRWVRVLIALAALSATAIAQKVSIAMLSDDPLNSVPDNPAPVIPAPVGSGSVAASPLVPGNLPDRHKFWDHENITLFATVAALNAADFAVTRSILRDGGRELNPVTRLFSGSTAGLASNFAGDTAGIIGLSYFFHKKGHHQLERITPLLNIGASSLAVTYDLNHR